MHLISDRNIIGIETLRNFSQNTDKVRFGYISDNIQLIPPLNKFRYLLNTDQKTLH